MVHTHKHIHTYICRAMYETEGIHLQRDRERGGDKEEGQVIQEVLIESKTIKIPKYSHK